MEGAGDELTGVPLALLPFTVGSFEVREDGVPDRLGSTLRFFAGGALSFFMVVAVPFFVLDGADRFFGFAGGCSIVLTSVVGTAIEDSRKGDCVRNPCSFFNEATVFNDC